MDLMSFVAVPLAAYVIVAAFVAFDAIIPALPGEVLVISSGALAAAGHLDVVWAVTAAVIGAIIGDLTVYSLSRHRLTGVLERYRLGRRIQATVDRAHVRMGSTSAGAIIAARFIPLGRTTVSAGAGLAGIAPRRFALLALTGCIAWASWTVGLGFVTGNVTDAPLWLQVAIGVAIGVLVGVWAGAVHTITRTRRRMTGRAQRNADGTVQTDGGDDDVSCESGPSRPRQLVP